MTVIDVDSHFEPTAFPPGEHPLWELREHLPSHADVMVESIAGDLYAALPPAQRPEPGALLVRLGGTMGLTAEQVEDLADAPRARLPGAADATERIAWMDRVGIDYALVNPGARTQEPSRSRASSSPTRSFVIARLCCATTISPTRLRTTSIASRR
jgi:hypothetical protein